MSDLLVHTEPQQSRASIPRRSVWARGVYPWVLFLSMAQIWGDLPGSNNAPQGLRSPLGMTKFSNEGHAYDVPNIETHHSSSPCSLPFSVYVEKCL
jgi:hypothetical protein